MNVDEKQLRFFYAQEMAAGMYDSTIHLVVPFYTHLHGMLIELIKKHVAKYREVLSTPVTILDIGFGTGAESLGVKRALPKCKILGLDLCKPMLDAFQTRWSDNRALRTDVDLIEGDFADEVGLPVSKIIETSPSRKRFSVVMTAFTFHHFTIEAKLAAYRKAHELLEPGGLFVNGDLFSFSHRFPLEWKNWSKEFSRVPNSSNLTEQAHKFDIAFIENSFEDEIAKPESERKSRIPTDKLRRSKAQWVHHYQTYNNLDSAEIQAAMLNEAGFDEVGIPFRYWQVGVLYGSKSRKPTSSRDD